MTKSLDDFIKAIQTVVGDVSGIRAAPEYAPDKLPPGIFSVALPQGGAYRLAPARVNRGLHNVQLYVVCPRVDLPKTLQAIIPLGDAVSLALYSDLCKIEDADNTSNIGATAETIGDIEYTFSTSINLGNGERPAWYAGWIFTIRVINIQTVVT